MRINMYTDEFTGDWDAVVNDTAVESGGEVIDGIRIYATGGEDMKVESGVTIWIPIDQYEEAAGMFEGIAEKLRELAETRSRS